MRSLGAFVMKCPGSCDSLCTGHFWCKVTWWQELECLALKSASYLPSAGTVQLN
jgi:hypothetical protein